MNELDMDQEFSLDNLRERAKELNCLYRIEERLSRAAVSMEEIFVSLVNTIPSGWQYPELCRARIVFSGQAFQTDDFPEGGRRMTADIIMEGRPQGRVEVAYREDKDFLPEEERLIRTIADRIAQTILQRRLSELSQVRQQGRRQNWSVLLEVMRRTDTSLFILLSRKMIYYLFWNGVREAERILQSFSVGRPEQGDAGEDSNQPSLKQSLAHILSLSDEVFRIADQYLSDEEILACIQKWIGEDRLSFLIKAIGHLETPFSEIVDALTRYRLLSAGEKIELSPFTEKGLRVALIRRFFSDHLDFINVAKNHIEVGDFHDLVSCIVAPVGSYGRLGGKSAGLFLAWQIIRKSEAMKADIPLMRVPKTWYIAADAIIHFLHYNNLEEVTEQKYKEIDQVRLEYPNIVQLLKNSHFPPEIVKGLSMALDDFGDRPLIVRSSSLLEDRHGTAFSGKYKSLFLANTGSKSQRLAALTDAVAEVYASVFGPDPIEYRAERGLLDFHEEMGIMIQEVVGRRVGPYYFPLYGGVVFSRNEFRWSARIRREDGLVRVVPGLGTRAVDRLSDDYPVLVAPGQPGLRANVTAEEILRYSPRYMDVINLESGCFETVEIREVLRQYGLQLPEFRQLLDVFEEDRVRPLSLLETDFSQLDTVVTFRNIFERTPFVSRLANMLKLLEEKLGVPVDLEFASDGRHFYLLQCRPQSNSRDNAPSPIPKNIPDNMTLFSANRFVSNGWVPDITHVVYVDPQKYNEMSNLTDLVRVGRVVGHLNQLLPKRQFILMGPGRWGSRGDIKLGVQVTYSDFNNTAMLIEIARKKGNYVPELSFGTHFFQDLVEAGIRYLPLYPDDAGIAFNETFLSRSDNMLPAILPEFAHMADAVRVIDIPKATDGMILRVAMNADLGEALAYFTPPSPRTQDDDRPLHQDHYGEDFWRWRLRMAERLASTLDGRRFGVKALYIFGSTKNATAGPGSDIDLLVHFVGNEAQKQDLQLWLRGWSQCMSELNFWRTGYRAAELLDVHFVTDRDIAAKTSYAVKIGAVTDAARQLPLASAVE